MTRLGDIQTTTLVEHMGPGRVEGRGRAGAELLLGGLAVLIPATIFIEYRIIGRLFLSEIILLGVFPVLLVTKGRLLLTRLPFIFILLGLSWLGSQIVTDLIRDTSFQDLSRGWAKIGMTIVNFVTLYMFLYGSRLRVILFTFGLGLGYLLTYIFNPTVHMLVDPWKFGVGYGVVHLVIVAALVRPLRDIWILPGAMLAATGFLSLYLGTRSLAGICIIGGVYMTLYQILHVRHATGARTSGRMIFVVVVIGVASMAIAQAYVYAAGKGTLGVDAQDRYQTQAETGLGFLLGGRTEVMISTLAVKESPVIGHGSWAKNPYYASMLLRFRPELTADYESGLIPTHSYLFGAWVEAGLLGALFWAWVWFLNARALVRVFSISEPLVLIFGVVGFVMAWDILFSPYGAIQRIVAPFYIVVTMLLLQMVEYWRKAGRQSVGRGVKGGAP